MIKLILGDCLEKLKELEENSVDSIVTDPPYELGFMGKSWDNTGIANNIEMWKECLRVLKPGGHLLAFSGTRTYHRMAVAIEDAGFEVRDMIEWVYGSGFPKSLNIGKAVDKLQGNEREDLGEKIRLGDNKAYPKNASRDEKEYQGLACGDGMGRLTKGTSEWEGWGTALKPAHEPICMARKPLAEKTVAENCLKYGTGGINIDESRVGTEDNLNGGAYSGGERSEGDWKNNSGFKNDKLEAFEQPQGRFPANLIHDNSKEVRECFPETKSGKMKEGQERNSKPLFGTENDHISETYGDSGNASRFFKSIVYVPKASKSERNKGLDNLVLVDIMEVLNNNTTLCEKSLIKEVKLAQLLVGMEQSGFTVTAVSGTQNKSVTEWSIGLFGKDITEKYQEDYKSIILTETQSTMTLRIYKWLIHLLTSGYIQDVNLETATGGNLVGSAENYSELTITISEKMALALGVRNVQSPTQLKISVKEGKSGHPTVKPIALMEYLIKMVTRQGGIVLDPFMGSGSTGVACKENGFSFIGIEQEEEYLKIAKSRIDSVPKNLFNL